MAFRNWRLGMHIQQDSIAIVALLHERSHWALRRWWRIPLPPGLVRQGMVADVSALGSRLAAWRRELPAQHQVSIAFPAVRTLQKRLPYPQFALREREQATWVASAMSQQLAMPASALCIDYAPTSRDDGWQVTAAQRLDINVLRELAGRLRLRVAAIVPDASALGAFFPWTIPAQWSLYVAAGLLAALDSALGGFRARVKGEFKLGVFLSGTIGNAAIAVFLTWLGQKLGLPLYLAAVLVFGTRMFQNFAEIRRELLTSKQKRAKISQDIVRDGEDGTK